MSLIISDNENDNENRVARRGGKRKIDIIRHLRTTRIGVIEVNSLYPELRNLRSFCKLYSTFRVTAIRVGCDIDGRRERSF